MRAQILSIGSELILGHLTDTNATFLAQQLAALGIDLTLVTQVGDDLLLLVSVMDRASRDADVVVCSGGVGPTADDLTREAIAQVFGEQPSVDPQLLETIRAFFRARGVDMPERNSKQAWLIPSAEALPNPVGTAPGWFATKGDRTIVAMPGVPREMHRMWAEQVAPRLTRLMTGQSVSSTTLKTIGIGESAAEQLLEDLVAVDNPIVATYAKDDGVHVRVTAKGATAEKAEQLRDEAVAAVKHRLRAYIYGVDSTTLPEALAKLLLPSRHRISIIDEGGGGRFASLLASNPVSLPALEWSRMSPPRKGSSAMVAAATALESAKNATIGMGIVVDVEPGGNGVFEGTIETAIAGPIRVEETSKIRSGFEDVQRRSALVAADMLRRSLLRSN